MSHPTLGKAGAVRGGLRAGQRWDAVRAAPLVPDNAGRREGATREGAGGSTWDVQVTAGVLSDLSGVKTQLKPIKNLINSDPRCRHKAIFALLNFIRLSNSPLKCLEHYSLFEYKQYIFTFN